jgi:hypothetical protein
MKRILCLLALITAVLTALPAFPQSSIDPAKPWPQAGCPPRCPFDGTYIGTQRTTRSNGPICAGDRNDIQVVVKDGVLTAGGKPDLEGPVAGDGTFSFSSSSKSYGSALPVRKSIQGMIRDGKIEAVIVSGPCETHLSLIKH